MDFVAFGLILDDIVFPDGRSAMGVLGGGGPQAAFGMRLWSESVGLVASVGRDLPQDAREWLRASGVDCDGVRVADLPTPRARQIMERGGRRTQLWSVPEDVALAQLRRSPDRLPEAYRRALGFHFGVHPDEPDLGFAAALRAFGGLVSIEAFKPADRRPDPETLHTLLAAGHIVSLTLAEARSLVGQGQPGALTRRLVESGAWILTLRMGPEGSIVMNGQAGRGAHIPAVPTTVVDPVGAGNAYCGGFLVGWAETHDVVTAGVYGAVSASFVVEQVGVPVVTPLIRAEARERVEALRTLVESM